VTLELTGFLQLQWFFFE